MNTKTAADYRAMASEELRKADDSFDRCDIDGFVTQAAHGLMAREYQLQAQIEEHRGRWPMKALFDLEGNLVAAKLIKTQYGEAWGILENDDPRSRIVKWVNPSQASLGKTRVANMAKKGYKVGYVLVPAKATLGGGGTGFGGMASVYAYAERLDGGFSRDVEFHSWDDEDI